MKILIIDDNYRLSDRTKEKLQKRYIVEQSFSGEEGLVLLSETPCDLVLLDLGLPGMPGLDVCTQIKKFWPETAILVITGEDSMLSKVTLLQAGADDYITKPYDSPELHARIQALLRRKQNSTYRPKICIDTLEINLDARTVTREGKDIILRRKEFDILEYLCLNQGRVLTREMIVHQAWPSSSDGGTGSVDVHVKQIRDRIDRPFSKKLIKTVYGLGYMIQQ